MFIRYSSFDYCVDNNNADLYSVNHQTTTVHMQRIFTQDWRNSYYWLPVLSCLFIFLYAHVNSLTNILEVECLCFRFLENSIATKLLLMCFVHIACCCVRLLVYPYFPHWCCWFSLCVCIAFNYRFNHVKPWYTVSIFVSNQKNKIKKNKI